MDTANLWPVPAEGAELGAVNLRSAPGSTYPDPNNATVHLTVYTYITFAQKKPLHPLHLAIQNILLAVSVNPFHYFFYKKRVGPEKMHQ